MVPASLPPSLFLLCHSSPLAKTSVSTIRSLN
ncbi:hypothetical protein E2C01_085468 [Portunus trituberculatus]|uniref:Uncharacterized protein n=1 Tax=Portunus trituberculatus TaxID=210409 RepID=A0A5B7J6U0_PORTR|nr:hypothetical protein [Portunus trituberculatus]